MKFLLTCLFLAIVGLATDGLAVTIFEDGGTTDFAGADPTGAVVRDSPAGDPTAYRIRGAMIALRRSQADLIYVEQLGGEGAR